MTIFWGIFACLAILFAFYGGIIVGVSDCKRRFNIPKGADPATAVYGEISHDN